jgi:Ca2+-binding RTX toxin-like protein
MTLFNGTGFNDVIAPNLANPFAITGDIVLLPSAIPLSPSIFSGADLINGLAGADTLGGGDGDDRLNGGPGIDDLRGESGSDTLDGGAGLGNLLNGGLGDEIDFVTYENDTGFISVNLNTGFGFSFGRSDTLSNIEGVIGSLGSTNTLTGDNNNNVLRGGNLNDFMNGGGGDDTLEGGNGDNNLTGGGGSDLLSAGIGNDTYTIDFVALAGGTQIEDGGGVDTLAFSPALTLVAAPPSVGTIGMGRSGENLLIDISQDGVINPADDLTILNFYDNPTDTIAGTGFIETVSNLPGNTILNLVQIIPKVEITTPAANNTTPGLPVGGITPFSNLDLPGGEQLYLFSNEPDFEPIPAAAAGRQVLALSGNDNVTGTNGADDVVGNKGADTLNGGGGNDTLRGGQGSDLINGEANDDLLNGNQDNDTLNGGLGNDIVRGGKGEDVLFGNEGNDFLIGDRDQDVLTGGLGADHFVLVSGDAAANSLDEADLITDFVAGTDNIMLTDGLTFADLSLTQVELQVDGGASMMSIAIQAPDNSYLGIVQNSLGLVAGDFVLEDPNITMLG